MAQNRRWYKLDNIGTYYAAQAMTQNQTVFRLSATLAEPVRADALQSALNTVLGAYPNFNVSLKNGLFWHYLEAREKPIEVKPEKLPICHPLHLQSGAALLRVSYFENRINFEISHMISDGRGALLFFEDLLSAYCSAAFDVSLELPHAHKTTNDQKAEDSFLAHYDKSIASAPPAKMPYHIKSAKSLDYTTYLEVHMKTSDIVSRAKGLGCTVTALLIAVVVKAIAASERLENVNKPIRIGVPVDLREMYQSTTSRNFFGMAFVDVSQVQKSESLDVLAKRINTDLKAAINPGKMAARMNRMVKLEKSKAIRFAPSPLKDFGVRVGEWWTNKGVTSTVSNLGIAHLPVECTPYVTNINILTATKNLNFTAISYGEDFSLTISSVLVKQTVIAAVLEELAAFARLDVNIAKSNNKHELPKLLAPSERIELNYDVFPHNRLASPRRIAVGILTAFTLLGFIALIVLACIFAWPPFIPALACGGLWANFLFVRNIIRRSVGFVRAASRYYFILIALCLLWYLTTHFAPVVEVALPILCITGLAFDFCLALVLHTNVVRDYAKYLFFDVPIGLLPLLLAVLGACGLGPLAIISAGLSGALFLTLVLFVRKNVVAEAEKFFSARK